MHRHKMENYTFEPDSERNSREGKIRVKNKNMHVENRPFGHILLMGFTGIRTFWPSDPSQGSMTFSVLG